MSIEAVAARMSAGESARFDATSTAFPLRPRERLSKWSMIAWRFEPRPEASTASRDGIPDFTARRGSQEDQKASRLRLQAMPRARSHPLALCGDLRPWPCGTESGFLGRVA